MQRRELMRALAALAATAPAAAVLASESRNSRTRGGTGTNLAPPTHPKARVIVVGGGMAGATVAKYLRLWGDQVDVTLVDRANSYTSCIMSSLVLTGQRTMSSLAFNHDTLRTRYGIRTVYGEVTSIDPVSCRVTLASGQVLMGDRLVLAPGIAFDDVPGLADANAMPHAWKAGDQTALLARQLAAMPANGVAVLTIPKAPYRCPPGPYERACLLADWLRVKKPQAKLVVLDANLDFVTEKDNFSRAFFDLHGRVIEYHNNVDITNVDTAQRTLYFNGNQSLRADVVNLIPRQRAPRLLADAGLLTDASGRFAPVDVLSYAHLAYPRTHVIGDSSATTQPKAGHIANQEAKVCADALSRIFAGGSPDPSPVTNSACYSTITMTQASWLEAVFQFDPGTHSMQAAAAGSGASSGWSSDNFKQMSTWFQALMTDTFA
ncbi:MAG: FAD/NAD(P)-binding oxidoreductase [Rubrivivax sp.]